MRGVVIGEDVEVVEADLRKDSKRTDEFERALKEVAGALS